MTNTPFSFKDTKKNVLKNDDEIPKKVKIGRPKVLEKKKNKVICYFSDDEYREIMAFLDGRPASAYLRPLILSNIRNKQDHK